MPGNSASSSSSPENSALLAFPGTSALNLKIFPVAGVPTADAPADEEEEHAVAEDATRSGVSGPKSAARRSAQYGDVAGADPDEAGPLGAASWEGEGEGARSKSARLDPVRLGMKRSL
jgi:hypothetical protein